MVPSEPATSSGDGAITYRVLGSSSADCSVDSATGAVTFTSSGTCVVRATAAASASMDSGYTDVTFTLMTDLAVSGSRHANEIGLVALASLLFGFVFLVTAARRRSL